MKRAPNSIRASAKTIVICAVLLAFVSFATAASITHFHRDADSAAHCVLCHVSHSRVARTAASAPLAAPRSAAREFSAEARRLCYQFTLAPANPRAPPA